MDDLFVRTVAALQANLILLESQKTALSDFQDMQAMRRLKVEVEEYVQGHAAKGDLPSNPLKAIEPRIEALHRFFQCAREGSAQLLEWRIDWLNAVPFVSWNELQQAQTEVREIQQQLPSSQGTLRAMLDPLDWDPGGSHPDLYPELRICAAAMPHLNIPEVETSTALYAFAHSDGGLHETINNHLNAIGTRIDELSRLHARHLTCVAKAEAHLANQNFRSAAEVIGIIANERFADIDYSNVKSELEEQAAFLKRFEALSAVIEERLRKGQLKSVSKELKYLLGKGVERNSELGAEIEIMSTRMQSVIASWLQHRTRKHIIAATIIGIGLTVAAAFAYQSIKHRLKTQEKFQAKTAGAVATLPIVGQTHMSFAYCPQGTFTIGSPQSEEGHADDENQVPVTITKGFWLAKTEVTQAQWAAVMKSNPSNFNGHNRPVENVSWNDAVEFIKKVNASEVLPRGWKMVLPTEAQWEYACRAGEAGPYAGGSIDEVAWYEENQVIHTFKVGDKMHNAWGFYDMHGNVWEWCADSYDARLLGGIDPAVTSSGLFRVLRGGSWDSDAASCRAAERHANYPGDRSNNLGFRPALVPSE